MKKLIQLLLACLLVFAGYHFFTGDYLANDIDSGVINGGGSTNPGGDSTSSPTTPSRALYEITIDGVTYIEDTYFDIFNKENNKSYTDWQYLGTSTEYGQFILSRYFANINGYPCVMYLYSDITTEEEFFANDWSNYTDTGPRSSSLTVFNYDITDRYYLSSQGTIVAVPITAPSNPYFPTYDTESKVLEKYNADLSNYHCGDNVILKDNGFFQSFLILKRKDDSSTLSLRKENNGNEESIESVAKYDVIDEYIPTTEESEYTWGELIYPEG